MGIELELGVLLLAVILGTSFFSRFENETPGWRLFLKWVIVSGATLGLYFAVGHWALALPLVAAGAGGTFHFVWCRKHAIHPFHATPRKRYYELRGWPWVE